MIVRVSCFLRRSPDKFLWLREKIDTQLGVQSTVLDLSSESSSDSVVCKLETQPGDPPLTQQEQARLKQVIETIVYEWSRPLSVTVVVTFGVHRPARTLALAD